MWYNVSFSLNASALKHSTAHPNVSEFSLIAWGAANGFAGTAQRNQALLQGEQAAHEDS